MVWRPSRVSTVCLAATAATLLAAGCTPASQSAYSPGAIPYNVCEELAIPTTPGRPFRAELNARRVENRPDGSTVVYESHCVVGRDADGRTLSIALPSPVVSLAEGGTASVTGATVILDPRTPLELRWDAGVQVVRQLPPKSGQFNVSTTFNAQCGPNRSVLPSLLNTRRFESLGERSVSGVPAIGCRVTTGPESAPESEAYVYESWASSELGVEVHRRRRDGRAHYEETMSLDKLRREAPGAALFQPPTGYAVRTLNEAMLDAKNARMPIASPESLAGRWETDIDPSGIVDGLLLTVLTDVEDGPPRIASLTIGVYRREAGQERFAYFIANEGPVTWDGTRLRIEFDPGRMGIVVDIDLTFDEPRARWLGTFGRNRDVRTVELRRPGAFSSAPTPDRLVGNWCDARPSNDPASPRCIRFAQGSDGVLLAWLDRCCFGVVRYGHRLAISRATPESIELTVVSAGGNQHGFAGTLSPDGTSIEGNWLFNRSQLPTTTLRRSGAPRQ